MKPRWPANAAVQSTGRQSCTSSAWMSPSTFSTPAGSAASSSTGSFGTSLRSSQPITPMLLQRIPLTFEPRFHGPHHRLVNPPSLSASIPPSARIPLPTTSSAVFSIPADLCPQLRLGTMIVLYPSICALGAADGSLFPFSPTRWAIWDDDNPALVLGSQSTGSTMRMTRTMMLETLRQELHPHRLVERSQRKGCRYPPCHEECADTGGHTGGGQIPSLVGGAVISSRYLIFPVWTFNDRRPERP